MRRNDCCRGALAGAAALALALVAPVQAAAQQAAGQTAAAHPAGEPAGHGPQSHEIYFGAVLFDRLEWGTGLDGTPNVARWDGRAWYGTDYDKVYLRTEGEAERGRRFERAEVQLLYSRLIGYFWDFQAGVRTDIRPGPTRTYGVLGIQGLAPGLFEVDIQGFVSERGDFSARFEASYDIYVTQRLVLQPNVEINAAIQRVPELGIGSGVNSVEAGLRLRYEVTREVSPYIGVHLTRRIGDTARYARREGERVEGVEFVTGLRLFF